MEFSSSDSTSSGEVKFGEKVFVVVVVSCTTVVEKGTRRGPSCKEDFLVLSSVLCADVRSVGAKMVVVGV